MNFEPITTKHPRDTAIPLIISSPHSGRTYPEDFKFICSEVDLRYTEDSYVDDLIEGATASGATIIQAEFPRSYIDVNRSEDDLDPALLGETWPSRLKPSERTLRGLGLVRRLCKSGVPMYAAPLSVADIQHRLTTCYHTYHAQLQSLLNDNLKKYGNTYLVDCHSMPSQGGEGPYRQRPDIIIGTRDGTTCNEPYTEVVQHSLENMGYSVVLNNPYKGMEILRRYGIPHKNQQALQLEMNRRLYMNENTLLKHDGFDKLKNNLTLLFQNIADYISDATDDRLAAE